jgi:hypothetical protein
MNALDEMFRAMAEAALAPAARAKTNAANVVWSPETDVLAWLRDALAARGDPITALRFRHEALGARFEKRPPEPKWKRSGARTREDYETRRRGSTRLIACGSEGGRMKSRAPLAARAARARHPRSRVADPAAAAPGSLPRLCFACPAPDDERLILTEYIVDGIRAGPASRKRAWASRSSAGRRVYVAGGTGAPGDERVRCQYPGAPRARRGGDPRREPRIAPRSPIIRQPAADQELAGNVK